MDQEQAADLVADSAPLEQPEAGPSRLKRPAVPRGAMESAPSAKRPRRPVVYRPTETEPTRVNTNEIAKVWEKFSEKPREPREHGHLSLASLYSSKPLIADAQLYQLDGESGISLAQAMAIKSRAPSVAARLRRVGISTLDLPLKLDAIPNEVTVRLNEKAVAEAFHRKVPVGYLSARVPRTLAIGSFSADNCPRYLQRYLSDYKLYESYKEANGGDFSDEQWAELFDYGNIDLDGYLDSGVFPVYKQSTTTTKQYAGAKDEYALTIAAIQAASVEEQGPASAQLSDALYQFAGSYYHCYVKLRYGVGSAEGLAGRVAAGIEVQKWARNARAASVPKESMTPYDDAIRKCFTSYPAFKSMIKTMIPLHTVTWHRGVPENPVEWLYITNGRVASVKYEVEGTTYEVPVLTINAESMAGPPWINLKKGTSTNPKKHQVLLPALAAANDIAERVTGMTRNEIKRALATGGDLAWLRIIAAKAKMEIMSTEKLANKARIICATSSILTLPCLPAFKHPHKAIKSILAGDDEGHSLLHLSLMGGDAVHLQNAVIQSYQKPLVFFYSDNVFLIDRGNIASMDASSMESSVMTGPSSFIVRYLLEDFWNVRFDADGNVTDKGHFSGSLAKFCTELLPRAACNSIGVINNTHYEIPGQGSGIAGTNFFNSALMAIPCFFIQHNANKLAEKREYGSPNPGPNAIVNDDGSIQPWVLKVFHRCGVKIKEEGGAFIENTKYPESVSLEAAFHNPFSLEYDGDVATTAILGMNFFFFEVGPTEERRKYILPCLESDRAMRSIPFNKHPESHRQLTQAQNVIGQNAPAASRRRAEGMAQAISNSVRYYTYQTLTYPYVTLREALKQLQFESARRVRGHVSSSIYGRALLQQAASSAAKSVQKIAGLTDDQSESLADLGGVVARDLPAEMKFLEATADLEMILAILDYHTASPWIILSISAPDIKSSRGRPWKEACDLLLREVVGKESLHSIINQVVPAHIVAIESAYKDALPIPTEARDRARTHLEKIFAMASRNEDAEDTVSGKQDSAPTTDAGSDNWMELGDQSAGGPAAPVPDRSVGETTAVPSTAAESRPQLEHGFIDAPAPVRRARPTAGDLLAAFEEPVRPRVARARGRVGKKRDERGVIDTPTSSAAKYSATQAEISSDEL